MGEMRLSTEIYLERDFLEAYCFDGETLGRLY